MPEELPELTAHLPVGNGNLKSELQMNAALFNGGKVHLLTDKVARCGVGKHRTHRQWQMDLGEVTCRRCLKLRLVDQQRVIPDGDSSPMAREERK